MEGWKKGKSGRRRRRERKKQEHDYWNGNGSQSCLRRDKQKNPIFEAADATKSDRNRKVDRIQVDNIETDLTEFHEKKGGKENHRKTPHQNLRLRSVKTRTDCRNEPELTRMPQLSIPSRTSRTVWTVVKTPRSLFLWTKDVITQFTRRWRWLDAPIAVQWRHVDGLAIDCRSLVRLPSFDHDDMTTTAFNGYVAPNSVSAVSAGPPIQNTATILESRSFWHQGFCGNEGGAVSHSKAITTLYQTTRHQSQLRPEYSTSGGKLQTSSRSLPGCQTATTVAAEYSEYSIWNTKKTDWQSFHTNEIPSWGLIWTLRWEWHGGKGFKTSSTGTWD